MSKTTNKFSPEVRARAVRMMLDHDGDYAWQGSGLWPTINHLLVMTARELCGREASPSAGVIDSQSVKTTESGGIRGYDAGKKIMGRKALLSLTKGAISSPTPAASCCSS